MTVVHVVVAVNLAIDLLISVVPGRTRLQDWEMPSRCNRGMAVYRSPQDFVSIVCMVGRAHVADRSSLVGPQSTSMQGYLFMVCVHLQCTCV